MNVLNLAFKNLRFRKLSTLLSVLLLTFGCGLISLILLAQNQLERQFIKNIEGVDMVVGAKGSPLQLILSAVYQIDAPTGNIPLSEFEKLQKNGLVKTAIPLSYGDSYKDFRIIGTDQSYLDLYDVIVKKFPQTGEVIIGTTVAKKAGLQVGDTFSGNHGLQNSIESHDHFAYTTIEILPNTGTVLDKLIIGNLESVWAVHDEGHGEGALLESEKGESEHDNHAHKNHNEASHSSHSEESNHSHNSTLTLEGGTDAHSSKDSIASQSTESNHSPSHSEAFTSSHSSPKQITAALLQFKGAMARIMLPSYINKNTGMMAALPAYEINRLFGLVADAVLFLQALALVIMLLSGVSVFIALYQSLQARKGELALLRNLGASRWQLFSLICAEGLLIAFFSLLLSFLMSRGILLLVGNSLSVGFTLAPNWFVILNAEYYLVAASFIISFFASLLPALQAFYLNIPKTLSNA